MQKNEFSARVVAFQFAAALERYELALRALKMPWLDLALLRRIQREFRQLRILGAALPRVSVSWMAVLVSRDHLLQALRAHTGRATAALHEHLASVEDLRARCLHLLARQETA